MVSLASKESYFSPPYVVAPTGSEAFHRIGGATAPPMIFVMAIERLDPTRKVWVYPVAVEGLLAEPFFTWG